MKVGIWTDTDINLAAMKISAWHKARGDSVGRWFPLAHYDLVYACKVFGDEYTRLPETYFLADEVVYGGTGFDIKVKYGKEKFKRGKKLPANIEHICPDYELFGVKNKAIGFTTRGCPNACGFCIVSCKEGVKSVKTADVTEFWRGQKEIDLMDANLLACPEHEKIIQQLIGSRAKVNFSQGLDARFITNDNAKQLSRISIKTVHFALDLPRNTDKVINGIVTYRKHNLHVDPRNICVYVLTNFNTTFDEDYERITRLQDIGVTPDVRIYRKNTAPRLTMDLARWCNNRFIYRSCPDFMDYVPRVDGKTIRQTYF